MNTKRTRRAGTAMMEVSLMCPIIAFLFAGALDLGYYAYALICLQNAARVAAVYTSSSTTASLDLGGACSLVLGEMNNLPNVGASTRTCFLLDPVIVTVLPVTGAGGTLASQVTVTYQSLSLIPIPGILAKQFTWSRTVKMPVRS